MQSIVRGHRFWFELRGDRGPPVVLIMGFGLSGRAWWPQVEALQADHRVLIFDHRGVGETEPSRVPYGFAELADDVVGLMDHVGFDRAHVVGVSMGGMVAQHVVLRHPDRVRSVGLIATLPGGSLRATLPSLSSIGLFLWANSTRGAMRLAALRRLLTIQAPARSTRALDDDDDGAARPTVPTLEVFTVPATVKTRLAQLRSVLTHDVTAELPRVSAPVLIVKPERDRLVRPDNSERLLALVPHATILRLADAGHGVTHQRADDVNAALRAHFSRADASAGAPA
jgi:3-oxoadipate enol-lactonase